MFRAALCMLTVQGSPSAENKDPPGNHPRFEAARQGFDEAQECLTQRILPEASRHISLAPGPERVSCKASLDKCFFPGTKCSETGRLMGGPTGSPSQTDGALFSVTTLTILFLMSFFLPHRDTLSSVQ